MKHQDALDQLARETSRARRWLAFERAARAGFALLAAIVLWTTLALVGAHAQLPPMPQSLAAIAALIVMLWLAFRAWRAWAAPSEEEARARLAADSQLDAGAFEALRDQPARFDPVAVAFWRRERERALQLAGRARFQPTEQLLDDLDPFKLRYVLLVALVTAAAFAGDGASDRMARAFLPDPGPLLGDRPMAIEAWVTPADYTHAGPISLSDRMGEQIDTPPSSEATVRLTGPVGAPRLVFEGRGGRRTARFTRAADGAWEARLAIPGVGRLKVVRFHTAASWRLTPRADRAPAASFAAPISQLPQEHARISWRASDDFGVRRLLLRVRPLDPPEGLLRADPVDTPLETPVGDPREAQAETEVDLAPHPYAGMWVEARIVAVDAIGQEGVSDPVHFTLPEKVFLQPLARAAIEIRRHILAERRPYRPERAQRRRTMPAGDILLGNQRLEVRDDSRQPNLRRAPDGVRRSAVLLDALTMMPEDGYFRDLAVYLGLRYARAQLDRARSIEQTDQAAETLWLTALRAEYGGAADAERAMLEAYMGLLEAMRDNAPPERLAQLMDALRQASERYMQALVQEALREGNVRNEDDTEDRLSVSQQDLDELLNQVQRSIEQGNMDEAMAALALHAMIMDNLQASVEQSTSGEGEGGEQQLQQSMDQLAETMGEQRALRADTQQRQDGQDGSAGAQLAQRQGQIRQGLAEAQRMADDAGAAPSEELNAAGEAMRRAEDALRRGDLEGAEAAQTAALENLRDGADALAAEMRARSRNGAAQQGQGGERDPLGRPARGSSDPGSETRVPTQADTVRAREIFDEIRRRAQDPNRPAAEREYLRRLLDRFGDSGS